MRSLLLLLFLAAVLILAGCSQAGRGRSDNDDDDDATEAPYEGDEEGECDDGADNDQDGLFDCDDEGCAGAPVCACDDTDGDGVCDEDDVCPDEDDTLDSDSDTVPDCLDVCPGADDLLDTDADTVADCLDPCPLDANDDSDGDGVCDTDDVCPGEDDSLDTDGDTVVDCLDPCPLDDPDDSDSDGVCDSDDRCPGFDDSIDANGDGLIDGCEQCYASGGYTQPDTDGDGLPEDCLLSVLLEDGETVQSDNIEIELLARGWTVTYTTSAAIAAMTDFSAYDVVALTFPGSAQPTVYSANAAGLVGVIVHRGGTEFDDTGLGTDSYWQSSECSVTDNTHFITEDFALGSLPLDYTYKTVVNGVAPGVDVLLSCSQPSLVAHPTLRRLTTPYYGHSSGMPWNAAGDLIDRRSYAWAAGFGP